MIIDLRGIQALQQLRQEFQESAGVAFPGSCLKEMLVLYDVCKKLEVPLTFTKVVLGAPAYDMVMDYINAPINLMPVSLEPVI